MPKAVGDLFLHVYSVCMPSVAIITADEARFTPRRNIISPQNVISAIAICWGKKRKVFFRSDLHWGIMVAFCHDCAERIVVFVA